MQSSPEETTIGKKAVQALDAIARLANVPRSMVSRALNDTPLLNAATERRIQTIACVHNFYINARAPNRRLRQSQTIAFVTPHLGSFVWSAST